MGIKVVMAAVAIQTGATGFEALYSYTYFV